MEVEMTMVRGIIQCAIHLNTVRDWEPAPVLGEESASNIDTDPSDPANRWFEGRGAGWNTSARQHFV